ncbi:hypothetical protein WA588_002358, partial [Blastocystis sp. NMH]
MLCCRCLLDGKESCGDTRPMRSLIGCNNARVASSILFLFLTRYLQRNPNCHVLLLKPKYCEESYSLLFCDKQSRRDPCLSRIHIKYVRSFRECSRFLLVAPLGYDVSMIAIDNWNVLMEEDGVVGRSQMVALLKQAGLPFVLVDNAATSSLIHQYSESYRSWFSDIFLIRNTSSTEYAFCRLFSSEGGVCDGLDGAVVSTDTTKPVDIRVAITTTATTPAASTPATIPAPSPSTPNLHPTQCSFSTTQTL